MTRRRFIFTKLYERLNGTVLLFCDPYRNTDTSNNFESFLFRNVSSLNPFAFRYLGASLPAFDTYAAFLIDT